MTNVANRDWYTPREVAEQFGIAANTVRKLAKEDGHVFGAPAVTQGSIVRISKVAIDQLHKKAGAA